MKQKNKPAVDLDNEETVQLLELGQSKKKKKKRQMGIAAAIILVGIISCFVIYPNMNSGARSVRAAEKAMEENDYDAAVKEFSHAIEIKKDDASLYRKRSNAYLKRAAAKKGSDKKKDIRNAEADAKKASKLNPKGTEERIQLATVYAEDGATDREEKTLQEAAEKTGKAYLYNTSISMGNTRMNLANNGLIVCDLDGNTYIANSPKVGSVEKVDKNGSGTVIYKDDGDNPISCLNLKGNKLIFQCNSVDQDEDPNRIVRVDIDGKNVHTLFKEQNPGDSDTGEIPIRYNTPVVCGNRLYLNYRNDSLKRNSDRNNAEDDFLTLSTNLDGKDQQVKPCKRFNSIKGFFPNYLSDKKVLCFGNQKFVLQPIHDAENWTLSTMKADGKDERQIVRIKDSKAAVTIQEDTIYICSGPNENGYIKINLYDFDGNLKEHYDSKIDMDPEDIEASDMRIVNLCVNEDRLYYDIQGYGYLCGCGNMKKDGTDNKLVGLEEDAGSAEDESDDDYYDEDEYYDDEY